MDCFSVRSSLHHPRVRIFAKEIFNSQSLGRRAAIFAVGCAVPIVTHQIVWTVLDWLTALHRCASIVATPGLTDWLCRIHVRLLHGLRLRRYHANRRLRSLLFQVSPLRPYDGRIRTTQDIAAFRVRLQPEGWPSFIQFTYGPLGDADATLAKQISASVHRYQRRCRTEVANKRRAAGVS